MKIGIDAIPLTIPFPCGTKHYAQELITHLAKLDKNNQYVIFASRKVSVPIQNNFQFVKIPSILPVLKRQFFLAYYATRKNLDLFHYLEPYGAIFFKHPKIITTVHDLELKNTYPLFSQYFLNRLQCEITRYAVFQKTKEFICVSPFVKKELQTHLTNFGKEVSIQVVCNGVSEKFKNLNLKKRISYFLCMGDFTVRKNIPMIIKAYSELPKEIRDDYELKIVASTDQAGESFNRLAKKLRIGSRVQVVINVSQDYLVKLYNEACVFIYASLYEGFGIPILEAMACGCPVITSHRGSMKEIAGDAALLVDPRSSEAIKNAIEKIVKNNKLAKSLKKKGLIRAEQFSWQKTAKKTLELYKTVSED
jgi:glycosyltransferase involved in cell wall biosynthesis